MMPFDIQPSSSLVPSSKRRELPGQVKGILGLKVLGCVVTMGISVLTLLAWSDPASEPIGMSSEMAHRVANYAMLASGASLLELLGVAGVWSFKRWGVYVLSGFSMLNFVIRMHSGDTFGAFLSIVATAIAGAAIATRWQDFE